MKSPRQLKTASAGRAVSRHDALRRRQGRFRHGRYGSAAITHKVATINGEAIPYTARAGYLVANDRSSALPAAKIFYVSFTADGVAPTDRRSTSSITAVPDLPWCFCCSGRLRRGASEPTCRTSLRRRPIRSKTTQTACSIAAISCSSIRSALVFGRDRSQHERRLLGGRQGRALDQAVRQAVPDGVQSLELAEIPVGRVLRDASDLRLDLDPARGRRRSERRRPAIIDPRFQRGREPDRTSPDLRRRRVGA